MLSELLKPVTQVDIAVDIFIINASDQLLMKQQPISIFFIVIYLHPNATKRMRFVVTENTDQNR